MWDGKASIAIDLRFGLKVVGFASWRNLDWAPGPMLVAHAFKLGRWRFNWKGLLSMVTRSCRSEIVFSPRRVLLVLTWKPNFTAAANEDPKGYCSLLADVVRHLAVRRPLPRQFMKGGLLWNCHYEWARQTPQDGLLGSWAAG